MATNLYPLDDGMCRQLFPAQCQQLERQFHSKWELMVGGARGTPPDRLYFKMEVSFDEEGYLKMGVAELRGLLAQEPFPLPGFQATKLTHQPQDGVQSWRKVQIGERGGEIVSYLQDMWPERLSGDRKRLRERASGQLEVLLESLRDCQEAMDWEDEREEEALRELEKAVAVSEESRKREEGMRRSSEVGGVQFHRLPPCGDPRLDEAFEKLRGLEEGFQELARQVFRKQGMEGWEVSLQLGVQPSFLAGEGDVTSG